MEAEKIDNWFTYHEPADGDVARYERLRQAGKHLALVINEMCPESADKTAAIRKVREAVMTANSSIACRGQ